MKSFEAMEEAIGKRAVDHAKALHLSSSIVHKWTEPSTDFTDSGTLNPLDRIETVMMTAKNLGATLVQYLSPLRYLAEQFGQILIPLPKVGSNHIELSKELIKTIEEFSKLAQESSMALEDLRVTKLEAKRIEKKGWDLIRQVADFVCTVRESAR